MAGFFNPKAARDAELSSYFASFNQVVSYLFDPDETFASCLREAGVRHLITGSPKILDTQHAAHQLAEPLQQLALFLDDPAAHFYPNESDLVRAGEVLGATETQLIAVHPGRGGAAKNWPLESWIELLETFLARNSARVLVAGGESDGPRLERLRELFGTRITFLEKPAIARAGRDFFSLLALRRPRQRHFASRGSGRDPVRAAFRADRSGNLGSAKCGRACPSGAGRGIGCTGSA